MKKETIERIIEREEHEHYTLREILTEELSKLNPNRIDEDRMREIAKKLDISHISYAQLRACVQEYNSTPQDRLI